MSWRAAIGALFCLVLPIGCTDRLTVLTAGDSGADAASIRDASADAVLPAPCDRGACFVEIAAGEGHTCARRADGQVMCWGTNANGQLGSLLDLALSPAFADIDTTSAIATGTFHTCAVREGVPFCWGANHAGQAGSAGSPVRTPTAVPGLTAIRTLALGTDASCALDESGAVFCWGADFFGQLGDGVPLDPGPVARPALVDFTASTIAAGHRHFCAASPSRFACWGANADGALGDGSASLAAAPTVGIAAMGIVWLAGGGTERPGDTASGHTCAVIEGGRVRCWGRGTEGQLGDGAMRSSTAGVEVATIDDAIAVACGGWHSCALLRDRQVVCWGANEDGQLGDGTFVQRATPVFVAGVTDAVALDAGAAHTCVARAMGTARCWGANALGQLGNGTQERSPRPVDVRAF